MKAMAELNTLSSLMGSTTNRDPLGRLQSSTAGLDQETPLSSPLLPPKKGKLAKNSLAEGVIFFMFEERNFNRCYWFCFKHF